MEKPRLYKTEAVVLKQMPIGEADRVLTLFTATMGKVRAVARGVRRPKSRMAGHLEPLVHCRLMLARGRTLDVVSGVETLHGFPHLRGDLEAIARALICAEMVDAFTPEEQANPAILDLLLGCLGWLEVGEKDRALRYFEFHLLRYLGYMPELHSCVACRGSISPEEHAFSPGLGGVVCLPCVRSGLPSVPVYPISLNALKVLRYLQSQSFEAVRGLRLDARLLAELESLMQKYVTYLLERQLKSPAFLDRLQHLKGPATTSGTASNYSVS